MATTIITSHKVDNYNSWKKAFDEGADMRHQANINILGVYQDHEDPNMVTIISEVPNIEMAKAMMTQPELQEVMKKAGVVDVPVSKYLVKSN